MKEGPATVGCTEGSQPQARSPAPQGVKRSGDSLIGGESCQHLFPRENAMKDRKTPKHRFRVEECWQQRTVALASCARSMMRVIREAYQAYLLDVEGFKACQSVCEEVIESADGLLDTMNRFPPGCYRERRAAIRRREGR